MKTPMLVYLFNNAADLQAYIFIKKRIQYRYFSVTFAKLF